MAYKNKICYVASADIALKFLLLNHLKFLKGIGYDVHAVCSEGKWVDDIRKEGIKVKTIKLKRKISTLYDVVSFLKLYLFFRKEKFCIVHTHTPKPGLLGQAAARLAGTPIVVNTIHGFYFSEKSSFLRRWFFTKTEKIAALFSDAVFFVNRQNTETAQKEKICSAEKIKYMGNGIDLERFNAGRFSDDYLDKKKRELGIGSKSKVVGIIGRLVEEKGYLDLFRAAAIVLKNNFDMIVLAIGPEDPFKKDAFNKNIVKDFNIEKNVIFLGERADVDELYPIMDIFVLPSYREGMPYSVLEASASGRPIIATDIWGLREAVENGKTGILIPVKNPVILAEKIIFLLKNEEAARKMGQAARIKSEKDFDERQIFNKILEEYKKLEEKKCRT